MADLKKKKCIPCSGDTEPLKINEINKLLEETPGWSLFSDFKLFQRLEFKDFEKLMTFVNAMAELAEEEGHHPDFHVHYNVLEIYIWTHKVHGLTESDFILASKISNLPH